MIPKIVVCRVHAHIHCGCVLYLTSIPPLTVFDDDAHDHDDDDDDACMMTSKSMIHKMGWRGLTMLK